MSDDPWDCFGDEDSDEDIIEDISQKETRLNLINKANLIQISGQVHDDRDLNTVKQCHDDSINDNDDNDGDDFVIPFGIEMWSHRPPLFMGPMVVTETTNCKRGYIATEDLKPGTLLLVEEPIFKWPEEQIGSELGMASVQAIMEHDLGQSIVHDMESLYPTRLDVDRVCRNTGENEYLNELNSESTDKIQIEDMVEIMQMQHSGGKELKKVIDEARRMKITCSAQNGRIKAVDEIDVMRMLLALRYNGFDSGLYLHFAMFNHDDDANCVKYLPENEISELNEGETPMPIYSEVRTTKFVKKGSPLTLHYLNPREVSHATRRSHIWEQHRFDIGANMKMHTSKLQEMEMVNGKFPESVKDRKDRETTTFLIESAINDLETLRKELDLASSSISLVQEKIGDTAIELFERCKALEMASHEMTKAAEMKLCNKKHILLIRCCRIHLDSSELLLRFGKGGHGQTSLALTSNQQLLIWCRFIQTCHTLLPIQIQYLGEHHPDIARTYYDFALGINFLLSRSPKKLFNIGLPELGSFASCQRFEAKCRQEHHRIDSLYPRDVEQNILRYRGRREQSLIK